VIIEDLLQLVSKIPAPAVEAIGRLVSAVLSHDDPARAAERAMAALASEKTSDEIIREKLGG